MRISNRLKFFVFLGLVCLLPLPAAAQVVDSKRVRILVPPSTSSLPLLLLADEDPIEDIDIQADLFLNHPQALALLLRGEADLLYTGTSQGWENYLNGGPLVLINTGTWGVSYLVGRDETIRSLADLAGKRMALPFPGAPLDFQTRYLLKKADLDPDLDLEISYSPPPQTVPRLLAGQVDAAPLPEPLVTNLVRNKGLKRLLDYKQAWAEASGGDPRSPQVSLFATRSYSRSHAEILGLLIEHWREATEKVRLNPDRIAQAYAPLLSLPVEVVAEAIRHTEYYLPQPAENRRQVRDYYRQVRDYLPGARGALGDEFFFGE